MAMIKFAKLKPSSTTPDFRDSDVSCFWFNQLKHIPASRLGEAMFKLIEGKYFPCIDEVRKQCGEVEFNEDEIAREFIPKIVNLVEKYGYTNPMNARKEIGEDRWQIIESLGGWDYICGLSYNEFTFLMPQWRETAKVIIKKQRHGISSDLLPIGQNHLKSLPLSEENYD
jgi:hypothetical protein